MAKRSPKKTGNQKGKKKAPAQPKTKQTAKPSKTGQTRMINGSMEYLGDNGWMPAVYHADIRARLLEDGPQGVYDIPRKHGKEANDITSFHPSYRTTGLDRRHRHEILFQYEQDGHPRASYTPEALISRGQIVLDTDDNPVRGWNEIPLVLSSLYEGYEMEVVRRLNPSITYQDFRARMPKFSTIGERREPVKLSTLSMRNGRFRLPACCLAWEAREGSRVIKDYIDSLLPRECHNANSTKGFRDLTNLEVKEATEQNKGHYPERAGNRALDEETRNQRNQIHEQRSAKLLKQHYDIVGGAPQTAVVDPEPRTRSQKRKRAASSIDPEDGEENTRSSKRQAGAMGTGISRDASRSALVKPALPKGTGSQKRKRGDSSFDTEDEEENTRSSKRQQGARGTASSRDASRSALVKPALQKVTGAQKRKRDRSFDAEDEEENARAAKHQELETGLEIPGFDQGNGASENEGASAEQPGMGDLPSDFNDLQSRSSSELRAEWGIDNNHKEWRPRQDQDISASGNEGARAEQPDMGGLPLEISKNIERKPSDQLRTDRPTSWRRDSSPSSTSSDSSQSPSASPHDEVRDRGPDYRYVRPGDVLDDQSLQMALCHTRAEIKEIIRPAYLPLDATYMLSYWEQWKQIVQSYLKHWYSVHPRGERAPDVLLLDAWYGDHTNWRLPRGY